MDKKQKVDFPRLKEYKAKLNSEYKKDPKAFKEKYGKKPPDLI